MVSSQNPRRPHPTGSRCSRAQRQAIRPSRACRPWTFERMEGRTLLSTFVVNTVSDLDRAGGLPAGQESLRQAIEDANTTSGADTIAFGIPGSGVQTIRPLRELPTITDPILIDGYTHSGPSGSLLILLDGSLAGRAVNGLSLSGGNSTVRGLAIDGFPLAAISLSGSSNRVVGNHIGTDVDGKIVGSRNGYGVVISQGNGNTIGGTTAADRNIIAGSLAGIDIGPACSFNVVEGNYLGVNADVQGYFDLGNGNGVRVAGPSNSVVGNVIAGNHNSQILIQGGSNNLVAGNAIGIDPTSMAPPAKVHADWSAPDGGFFGIEIDAASGNTIGGASSGAGNTIAFNGRVGVIADDQSSNNAILGNSIFSNGFGLYLHHVIRFVPPFDRSPSFPVLTSAISDGVNTTLQGTLDSTPDTNFRIEVFANPPGADSDYEGKVFLGYGPAMTDALGHASFSFSFPTGMAGPILTATATDAAGNTTEFSDALRTDNHAPVAVAGPDRTVNEGGTVAFDAGGSSDLDGDPLSYSWEFGDGTSGTGATPTHASFQTGAYVVTLTADDHVGGVSHSSLTVTVANVAPTVHDDAYSVGETSDPIAFPVDFSDPGQGETYGFRWHLVGSTNGQVIPDQTGTSADPTGSSRALRFTPIDDGTYTFAVTVTDDHGGVGTGRLVVTIVNAPPSAVLHQTGIFYAGLPGTVGFAADSDLIGDPIADPWDPSAADRAAGLHFAFAADGQSLDGATYAGSSPDPTGSLTLDAGEHTIRGRVIDQDGSFTEYTISVRVGSRGAGQPDPDFGTWITGSGQRASTSNIPPDLTRDPHARIALQADGKLLLAAFPSSGDIAVARYNRDGTPDTAFGNNGVLVTDLGIPSGEGAVDVAVQPWDQKIVVLFTTGDGNVGLVRYQPDGSLDTGDGGPGSGFGAVDAATGHRTGYVLRADALAGTGLDAPAFNGGYWGGLDPTWDGHEWSGIDFQSGGRILVGGTIDGIDPATGQGVAHFMTLRYTTDGQLDVTFGDQGVTIAARSADDHAGGMVVNADDSILVIGTSLSESSSTGYGLALARFNACGILDGTFGDGGWLLPSSPAGEVWPRAIARQLDGKIVVAGEAVVGASVGFAVIRLLPDGARDGSFGSGGLVTTTFVGPDPVYGHFLPAFGSGARGVAVQDDGKIVVAGTAWVQYTATSGFPLGCCPIVTDAAFALARFNSDGGLDPAFGDQGRSLSEFARGTYSADPADPGSNVFNDNRATDLIFQPDGQVVVAGWTIATNGTGYGLWNGRDSWRIGGDVVLARYDGGPQGIAGPTQVSGQLRNLERTVSQPGQSASITFQASDNAQLTEVINAADRYDPDQVDPITGNPNPLYDPYGLTAAPVGTMTITVNLAGGDYGGQTIHLWPGEMLVINGASGTTTFVGHSPALTVAAGTVIARGITFTNATDAPTILVSGGSLTLRDSTVQESTGYVQAAIRITAGTVDLGTATDPGNNVINVNGTGSLIQDTGPNPVSAIGASFTVGGAPITPSSLSGGDFADFNDDGQVDFGEQGIPCVPITLTGTDFLGNPVSLGQYTDADGTYVFQGLLPGTYTITETQQPAGYTPGITSVGTGGGTVSGAQFTVNLAAGEDAMNYNYGERPAATGSIKRGQTAGIGFWNNKNGQALIKALNGGTGHQLGDWLAATFPHLFGSLAGANNLACKSNAFIAALFQSDFVVHGTKLDAQVLATALAVYVTDSTLDNTGAGTPYGFIVAGNGVATSTVNVGSNGAAFGVANNTAMTVLDILLAADAQAVNGVLYNGNTTRRNQANTVFSAINEAGGL
jgi:uncharacterized delta-60 repeat protein